MRTARLLVDGGARSVQALRGLDTSHEPVPTLCNEEPQGVWWRLEDLFLRSAAVVPVSVHVDADGVRIVMHGIARRCEPGLDELRRAAQDVRTYAWQTDNARGSFARTLERHGSNLVCTLASPMHIERWPSGEPLACDMRRFLLELGARGLVGGRR